MAESIDSLQIEINAKASKANDAIDRLVGKIDRLTSAMNHLDGGKLASLANGVQRLGTAMQTMNSVGTADFTRLAKNLQTLNNIDVSKLSNLSANINHIGTAFKGLSGVSQGAKEITDLANGIKQLGYKSADKAITNIPLLAEAMKKLMAELSKAPKVSQNLIDMTNALAKLARTGASSGTAAKSITNAFDGIYRSSNKASIGVLNLKGKFQGLFRTLAPYIGIWKLFSFAKQAIEISSDLTEVQNVVDVTFGNFADKLEALADVSIPELGMSELTTKQIASKFQAMGTAMGFAQGNMADMSVELTRLTGDMASFYNVEQEAVGEDLESIFTGQTKPLRQYGLDLTEATLQEWALKNGIDANINSMSQMEKTMLRYQYVLANTGAAQGDFLRTQDTWANQVRILKQNFQQLASVLGGTLINALKPLVKALNVVMSKIIAFAKVISDALGTIFGWTYEEGSGGGVADDFGDAASSADDLAGSTGKAAKNIKEMKAGLRAFDELKTINMPDNSDTSGGGSGGGTGGGAGGAGADGGQWKKTETKFFDSDIDTLYKLGKAISEALIDAMESIDWDSIYEKARNFGKGLADFLNGLFAGYNGKTLFGELGRTIASALNTAVYAALEFAKEFDFKQFGYNIADGINNFFKTFDFTALAQTLNLWAKGILAALNEAITKTDWKMVGNKIGEFLRELDFVDIATDIADTLWEAIKAAIAFWHGMFDEAPVETVLLTAFGVMKFTKVGKLIAGKISKQIVAWLGTALGVEVAADATIGSVIAAGIGAKLTAAIASAGGISGLLTLDMAALVGETGFATLGLLAGGALIGGIIAAFTGWHLGQWLNEWITGEKISMSFLEQMDEIKSSFSDGSWKEAFSLWRDDIAENLAQMTVDFQTKFDEIKTNVLNKATEIKESASSKWQSMKEDIKGANALIKQDMDDTLTKIAGKIDSWYTNDVAPWFTVEKWQAFGKNIKESLSNKWTEFTNWWSNTGFANWWNNQVTPWFQADKWKFDGIKSGLTSAWNGAIDGIKQIWNNFANWLNSKLTFTIDPIVVAGKTVFEGTTINLGKIPTFYTGGFPEDGWFRASHGEMLGRFDNGQSVVANNMQITEGISDAVYRGNQQMVSYMQQEITELRKQNEYLMQIASKEFGISEKQIGQSARKYAREYAMRTGREAYSF